MRRISPIQWVQDALGPGFLAAVLWLGLPAAGEAAGPWRAQVVDADTGQPLGGVAVIAVWYRRAGGHPAFPIGPTGLVDSAEAVTDAQGRFTLPFRIFFDPGLFTRIDGPDLGLFLAGYGGWRFRDWEAPLTKPGAVIEMRPLPTPDEPRKYLEQRWTRAEHDRLRVGWQHATGPADWIDLPYQQARGYEAAINRERAALGLRPIGIGYPYLGTEYLKPAPPKEGPDAARLRGASAVAIDAAGLRYVADTEHHRIVVFDAAGAMVRTWGRFGREAGEFQSPGGVAVDRAGTVYVADWGNHRIQTFTREGQLLGRFGGLRFVDYDGQFSPTFVAAPDTGEIVVNSGYGVYVFTPSGQRLGRVRFPFAVEHRCEIAVDAAGHVYAVDARERRIHKVDLRGRLLASWGRGQGDGPGQLFDPAGLAVDAAGSIYVADWHPTRARVQQFDAQGRFVRAWTAADDGQRFRSPRGLAIDAQGRLHVADGYRAELVTITPGMEP